MNVTFQGADGLVQLAFPARSPAFVARTRTSAVSIVRFRADIPKGDVLEGTMDAEDAYMALFQLRDHAVHEFGSGGKMTAVDPVPRGGLHLIDIRSQPMCRHRHSFDSLMLHLPRAVLDEMAEDAGAPRISELAVPDPWCTPDPVLAQLHGVLVDAAQSRQPADSLLHEHVAIGVAAHLATTYGGLRPRGGIRRGGLAPWQERRAKELLAANLGKEMSLLDIARECDLSLAYFGRAFKVSVGMSPHAWRQSRRVEEAKALLRSSATPLAEIAAACGFADQSHFSRVFALHTKLTPGAWRRIQGVRGH